MFVCSLVKKKISSSFLSKYHVKIQSNSDDPSPKIFFERQKLWWCQSKTSKTSSTRKSSFKMKLLIFLLSIIKISEATIYYVRSEIGSNSNDGLTPQTALATLANAASRVSPGDEIDSVGLFTNFNYGSGRYTNRPSVMTISTSNITVRGNGASVLRYDGASGISISGGTNFVTIEGFEIEGPAQQINYTMAIANRFRNSTTEAKNFYSNRGIVGWGPSHHITVRDCYVHDTCASGIRFNDADYITIEDCTVTRTSYWSSAAESAIVMAESLAIDNSTDIKMIFRRNALFENWNRIPFYQPSHDGLSAYPDYGEASQNYILDGQGLYVTRSDDHYMGTFLFENNIVASSGKNGINFDGTPAGGYVVFSNVALYCVPHSQQYHSNYTYLTLETQSYCEIQHAVSKRCVRFHTKRTRGSEQSCGCCG